MKLLIDMNLSPRWAQYLIEAGHEAVHWSELGAGNAADLVIMAHARVNHFVVLTHDLDFGAILVATHGDKPSVVQIRSEDVSPEAIGQQVLTAFHMLKTELESGTLVTIDRERTRLRVLPLRVKE